MVAFEIKFWLTAFHCVLAEYMAVFVVEIWNTFYSRYKFSGKKKKVRFNIQLK